MPASKIISKHQRIKDEYGGGSITLAKYYDRIALLRDERAETHADAQHILDERDEWGSRFGVVGGFPNATERDYSDCESKESP